MAPGVQKLVAAVAFETQFVPVLSQRWHLLSWKTKDREKAERLMSANIQIKQHLYRLLAVFIVSTTWGRLCHHFAVKSLSAERNDVPHCFTRHNNRFVLFCLWPWWASCHRASWITVLWGWGHWESLCTHKMLWWCHGRTDRQRQSSWDERGGGPHLTQIFCVTPPTKYGRQPPSTQFTVDPSCSRPPTRPHFRPFILPTPLQTGKGP